MNPLVHTMEAQFHGAANASALRELHKKGDLNGLLEYALLLAEMEASQKSQITWLMKELLIHGMPAHLRHGYIDQSSHNS